MEPKIFKEIRCVNEKTQKVSFIPQNLVEKPGYMYKHNLRVQDPDLIKRPETKPVALPTGPQAKKDETIQEKKAD
jgi:hypothetical protein